MKRFLFVSGFILAIIFVSSPMLHATILEIGFDLEFSGATPPEGSTPWLTATIDDETTDAVTLTLSAGGLVDSEFVSSWYFNVNPIYDPYSIMYPSAGYTPGTGDSFTTDTSQANWTSIGHDTDNWQADGDSGGLYDFVVHFATSGAGDGRLTAGEAFSITFDYDGLTAYDFLYGNEGSTKGGPFIMAAHVQGIGPEDEYSGWVAGTAAPVPEPSTIVLMGLGLVGLAGFGRKKFKK